MESRSLQCKCLVVSSQDLRQGVTGLQKAPASVCGNGECQGLWARHCVPYRCNQMEIRLSLPPMAPMWSHEHHSKRAGGGERESELTGKMHRIQRCRTEEIPNTNEVVF